MCGIAGFFAPESSQPADMLELRAKVMAGVMHHRGPDSHGVWVDSQHGLSLAHRRLAILDLSPAGHQPMISPSGRYVIVFNGEVYNFASLRNDLEKKNYHFNGNSDTEVMLAAFEAWGIEESLRKFNGMFAFALWDKKEQRLILARDRMGQKPLFAGWVGDTFFFASEIKAMQAHPDFNPAIQQQALPLYACYGMIPAPFSIYDGVFKIKPGEFHVVSAKNRDNWIKEGKKYYDLPKNASEMAEKDREWGEKDALDALEGHLKAAVSRRMIADVPLGAFLSGGIDSSLVVSLMQSLADKPVKTFTVGFDQPQYNEAPFAKRIATHLQTDHTEVYVSEKDALDLVPRLASLGDEPFADSSLIPTSMISGIARRDVTVALSGDGGDELFMGYRRHFIPSAVRERIPRLLHSLTGRILEKTPAKTFQAAAHLFHKDIKVNDVTDMRLHAMAGILRNQNAAGFYEHIVSWSQDSAKGLFHASGPSIESYGPELSGVLKTEEQMALLDMLIYMPEDIHMKVDRASMAHSLEARAPFMDPDVVNFSLSLPVSMKLRNGQGKWLLRQLLSRYVPTEMFERPKAGFAVPLDHWLRHELCDWSHENLAYLIGESDSLGMHGDVLRDLFDAYHKKGSGSPHFIWALCVLGQWHADMRKDFQ